MFLFYNNLSNKNDRVKFWKKAKKKKRKQLKEINTNLSDFIHINSTQNIEEYPFDITQFSNLRNYFGFVKKRKKKKNDADVLIVDNS